MANMKSVSSYQTRVNIKVKVFDAQTSKFLQTSNLHHCTTKNSGAAGRDGSMACPTILGPDPRSNPSQMANNSLDQKEKTLG